MPFIYLKNAPKNATIGNIFIQPYFCRCGSQYKINININNDFYYEEDITSVDHLHHLLLQGKNVLIYKFRLKRTYPEIVQSYLRKYHV